MSLPHFHHEYFRKDFLYSELENGENFRTVAEIFSLLSDTSRLRIFWLLCHSRECVLDIAEAMKMTNPAVSHHLKILKEAGLIESYRDGKEVFYAASKDAKTQSLHGMMEKLMSVTCPDFESRNERINENSEFMESQVKKIQEVHDFMCEHISERFTIDGLARKFGMNTTTLKTVFKDVYGTSLAAHIKEHRMEKAAELLTNTQMGISEVAAAVGYETQSKFSAAFKEFYGVIPSDYKKEKR